MTPKWVSELAGELKREMKARRLSQRKLAKLTGLGLGTIHNILTETSVPSVGTVRQIAESLGWGEDVFRAFMQTDIVPTDDVQKQRILALYEQLSEHRREDVLDLLQLWVERDR